VVVVFGVVPTQATLQAVVPERENLATVVGHFVEFAVFAFLAGQWLLARPTRGGYAKVLTLALVMTAALGGLIELVQGPLPYRDLQLSDLATDVAGGIAGLVVLSCVRRRSASAGRRRSG